MDRRLYAILGGRMPVYAATIFLSAFLLFQVQPLIAKFILPWFGGSAAVWSAALLFFQLILLAGYFYAYVLIRFLKPKQQFYVHAVLLAASLATLPIVPNAVVRKNAQRRDSLSALRALELRIVIGAAELSDAGGAAAHSAHSGCRMVVGICGVRDRLRHGRVEEQRGQSRGRSGGNVHGRSAAGGGPAGGSFARRKIFVDRPRCLCIRAAAGCYDVSHTERRAHSAVVGGAAQLVPAQLHPVF